MATTTKTIFSIGDESGKYYSGRIDTRVICEESDSSTAGKRKLVIQVQSTRSSDQGGIDNHQYYPDGKIQYRVNGGSWQTLENFCSRIPNLYAYLQTKDTWYNWQYLVSLSPLKFANKTWTIDKLNVGDIVDIRITNCTANTDHINRNQIYLYAEKILNNYYALNRDAGGNWPSMSVSVGGGTMKIYYGGAWRNVIPYVYSNKKWHVAIPYVYSNKKWNRSK